MSPPDRLESWKEIACYLGREVGTVQGWEKSQGLRVHRHQHGRQGSVYAFQSEFDAWRQARKLPAVVALSQQATLVPTTRPRLALIAGASLAVMVVAVSPFVYLPAMKRFLRLDLALLARADGAR